MSWMLMLIIGGWLSTAAIIAGLAVTQNEQRLDLDETIAAWLNASSSAVTTSEESA